MTAARRQAPAAWERLRVVDSLRFAAALAVVGFHYTGRDSVAWSESVRDVFPFLSRFTIYGGFGPYLFFMISGFVILMSTWGRSVPSFVGSRIGRLYPAYWFAVVLTALVLVTNRSILADWDAVGLPGAALNLTMFQSAFGVPHLDGAFWTLWVELKFYLLLLGMALIGITRERMLALCLVWPVLGALAARWNSPLLTELLVPKYAPFFCIGILIYLLHREGWSAATGLLLAMNYCFALWVCAAHYIPWSVRVAGAPVSFRALVVLLTLCVAALAVATLTRVSRVDWRWLTFLGALTYPLYVIHQVSGWVLLNRLGTVLPAYAALTLVMALMLVLAYLVHRYVERPFGGRLRRAVERDLYRTPARREPIAGGHDGTVHPAGAGRSRPLPPLPSSRVPVERSGDLLDPVPPGPGRR
ncbi:acyltransferase [Blastococcus sp. HT6-30]|uniref:acyltransferase family protein n=1 Tax=Blastococcus sp. HT6-30 TaxID=3144843 RepID=UPI0032194BCA